MSYNNIPVKKYSLERILNHELSDFEISPRKSIRSPSLSAHHHLAPFAGETPRILPNSHNSIHPIEEERETSQDIWMMGNYPLHLPGNHNEVLGARYRQISNVKNYYHYVNPYPDYPPSYYCYPYGYDNYSNNCNMYASVATAPDARHPHFETSTRPLVGSLTTDTAYLPRTEFPPSTVAIQSTLHRNVLEYETGTPFRRSTSFESPANPILPQDGLSSSASSTSRSQQQQATTTDLDLTANGNGAYNPSSFASTKPKSCKLCYTTASSGNWYRNVDRVVGGYICKSCYVCINRRLRADPQESLKTIIETMNDRRQVRVRPRLMSGVQRVCCGYDEDCGTTVSSGDWYKSKRVTGGWNCQRCYQRMKKMRKLEVV